MASAVEIHVDVAGDRVEGKRFAFTGWIVSDARVTAVALIEPEKKTLKLVERPDVTRVFPNREAIGFAGESGATTRLRFAVRIGEETVEREHALPPAVPKRSLGAGLGGHLRQAFSRGRARLTTNRERRWQMVRQRHLWLRRDRSGLFERRHADALLADFATAMPEAVFLQIGANDGRTGDPLFPLLARSDVRWRGVLVEPVLQLFAQLAERHQANPRLRLEQAAIGENDGLTTIHYPAFNRSDSLWLHQIPSLDADRVRQGAEALGGREKRIVSEEVPALTVATLLRRHRLTRVDLLVIDTEGWDWRVLRQFDLTDLGVKLLLYEHQHLSLGERAAAHEFLRRHHFSWAEMPEGDTLAWR